jgi:hypothetical protein
MKTAVKVEHDVTTLYRKGEAVFVTAEQWTVSHYLIVDQR